MEILKKLVPALEFCKAVKDLGWKWESAFYWYESALVDKNQAKLANVVSWQEYKDTLLKDENSLKYFYPAPTAEEFQRRFPTQYMTMFTRLGWIMIDAHQTRMEQPKIEQKNGEKFNSVGITFTRIPQCDSKVSAAECWARGYIYFSVQNIKRKAEKENVQNKEKNASS